MEEFDQCGFNNYLVTLDQAMSQIPQFVGSLSNAGTQVYMNESTKKTSLVQGIEDLKTSWNNNRDWKGIGKNYQLAWSSLLKYEAPDLNAEQLTFV